MQKYELNILLEVLLLVVFVNGVILRDDEKSDLDLIVSRQLLDLNELSSRQVTNFTTAQRKLQREMLNAHNTYRSAIVFDLFDLMIISVVQLKTMHNA
jgi:hypothetical protein